MAKHTKKQPSRQQLRSGAMLTLICSIILCLLVCMLAVLIMSPHSEPHVFRGLFIGLRDIFLSEKLVVWYETNALAPMIVNLLCLIPFLGFVISLWYLVDFPTLFQKISRTVQTPPVHRTGAGNRLDTQSPTPSPTPVPDHHTSGSDCDAWLAQKHKQAIALHAELKQSCAADGFDLENETLPLIRIQDFAIKNEKDYILSWNQNGYASIPVSPNVELTLALDQDRTPFILGSTDPSAPQQLTGHPLIPGEPLIIYRDGGSKPIRHYSITWIGGGPL